jgi:autotransporter-associated beta strand protein
METRSYALLLAAISAGSGHAQDLRSATTDPLSLPGAWVDGSVPTTADIATWNSASNLLNDLGANQTLGGLNLSGASGPVRITGPFNLTLDHATDANTVLDTGAQPFTWGEVGVGGQLNVVGALVTEAPGSGNTGAGATFAGSGIVTLSGTGTKNWSTSGNATSGANGVTHITFNGTLQLRGATTAPETLSGNWLALGGGGGLGDQSGTLVQSGAFHLDTGDAESRGELILTQAFNDQTLELLSLSGTGSIRADWGVGAPYSHRSIRISQDDDTTFSGGIYMHNGSGQRRDVTIIKEGSGTLTFTGRLGSSQSAGGNPSSLNFAINEGVWEMGDGVKNPTAPLNVTNWDSASTFSIASLGTLRFRSNATEYVWNRPLSGDGTIEIVGDGSLGTGRVALTGSHFEFTGETHVLGGRLRIGGDLGNSHVTVASGAGIDVGEAEIPGIGLVKALTLSGGSTSTFRAGGSWDQVVVSEVGGLAVAGPHVITAVSTGGLFPGERVSIIDYTGTFGNFAALSLAPGSRFSLVHNTANSSIDLEYTGGVITWTGSAGPTWDIDTTENWKLGGKPTHFLVGDEVRFDDSADNAQVTIAGTVSPAALTISNESLAYTLSGGAIAGTGHFTKLGAAAATVTSDTSYTGTTYVDGGTLTFGDGETRGEVGRGPVDILEGATLRIHRNDFLDYKADPRMRSVSGFGDVVLDGGVTLFNYPGTGVGFAETGSWAALAGNLIIKGNSEFQTIRNGATAMGTGSVILGDETSSGSLSQIEGNWTWTNDIVLVGNDNRIINRSAGSNRLMKIQGEISGDGRLTIEDATGAMNNLQTGFIFSGENALTGELVIPRGVPVRIGGLPGDTPTNQPGPGDAGSLGSADVINDGFLTFSRTDSHVVTNPISGEGEVFIGLASGTGDQVVTFTGTKDYMGPTTIRNGTLRVNTTLSDSMVFVEPAATLGGNGTLGFAALVSGTLAPGDAVGTLTSTSELILSSGSRIEWEISDWNGSAGTGYDTFNTQLLIVEATADAPLVVKIQPIALINFTEEARTFTLATTSGISGMNPELVTVDSSQFSGFGTWKVQVNGNLLELAYLPGTGNPYASWLHTYGIADTGADVDSDGDGVANGIEFVIGGNPMGSSSRPLLPTANWDSTHLSYVFRRSHVSSAFAPVVEYSSNLETWNTAQQGTDGVSISAEENYFGAGIDRVTVKIPRSLASSGKLFARLRIDLP